MASGNNKAIIDSLMAMRTSIESTYEVTTAMMEQELFIDAWTQQYEYAVFSDFRRNEGRRRILDIIDIIDRSLEQVHSADTRTASRIYVETLREVAKLMNLVRIIEMVTLNHGG